MQFVQLYLLCRINGVNMSKKKSNRATKTEHLRYKTDSAQSFLRSIIPEKEMFDAVIELIFQFGTFEQMCMVPNELFKESALDNIGFLLGRFYKLDEQGKIFWDDEVIPFIHQKTGYVVSISSVAGIVNCRIKQTNFVNHKKIFKYTDYEFVPPAYSETCSEYKAFLDALYDLCCFYQNENNKPLIRNSFLNLLDSIKEENILSILLPLYVEVVTSSKLFDIGQIVSFLENNEHIRADSIIGCKILGDLYLKNKDDDKVLEYFERSFAIAEKLRNEENFIPQKLFICLRKYEDQILLSQIETLHRIYATQNDLKGILFCQQFLYDHAKNPINAFSKDPKAVFAKKLYVTYLLLGNDEAAKMLAKKHNISTTFYDLSSKLFEGVYPSIEQIKSLDDYIDIINLLAVAYKYAVVANNIQHKEIYREFLCKKIDTEDSKILMYESQQASVYMLCNSEQPDKISKYLRESHFSDHKKSQLAYDLASLYPMVDNKLAIEYVSLALEYSPCNKVFLLFKNLMKIALNYQFQESNDKELIVNLGVDDNRNELTEVQIQYAKSDDSTNLSQKEPAVEFDEENYVNNYINDNFSDWNAVNEYFQAVKKKVLHDGGISKKDQNKCAGWLISDSIKIPFKSATNVFYKLYAIISPELSASIPRKDMAVWSKCLNNGLCSARNKQGVKFLAKSMYELKNFSYDLKDKRLVSTKTYKNPDGNQLVVFDLDLEHKGILRLTKDKKEGDLIPCENYLGEEVNDMHVPILGEASID